MTETLKERLERRMAEVGVKAKRLAQEAGLNETYIRDILKERSQHPTASRIEKVFETLDRLGGKDTSPLTSDNPEGRAQPVSPGEAPESEHLLRERNLILMWRDLEEPERVLTFDIVRAAAQSSLRRRYGTK